MQKYNKFIVALVTAVVTGLTIALDSPSWLTGLIPLLGSLGVYQVPNRGN